MTVGRDNFVGWQLTKVGTGYRNDEHRCDPNSPTHDCSGLPCASMRANGVPTFPCMDSYGLSASIRDGGHAVSIATARATKGYLLCRGGTSRAANPHGHVATSLGDGRTIEAYDTADGVIIGHIDGREWNDCGPMPGVDYTQPPRPNPGPRSPGEALDMGMTAAKLVPNSHPQTKAPWLGRQPFVGAIADPKTLVTELVGFNGAQVEGGVPFLGMSVRRLGVLHAPITEIDVNEHGELVGLAGDGGSFTFSATAHYL